PPPSGPCLRSRRRRPSRSPGGPLGPFWRRPCPRRGRGRGTARRRGRGGRTGSWGPPGWVRGERVAVLDVLQEAREASPGRVECGHTSIHAKEPLPPPAKPTNAPTHQKAAGRVLVHGSDQLPFPYQLRQPGLDATSWRAELAIRFGVILLSSDTNQILKFLPRFLVPRTKLLRRPVQTQSSWLAR